jgi:DHA1 family bicyclomycin/chloramphenicol resistance-like MFS transporter
MSPRDVAATDAAVLRTTPAVPVWLLVALTAIAPFTMQVLVPSVPGLARQPGGDAAALAISLYLVGVAVGQLIYGPLSDRYGRRPTMLVGLAAYLAASTFAVLAPSVGWLVVARVFQAMGACAGMVLARAIIRDIYPREQAASVLGYVTMGMAVAPMLSPIFGAQADAALGWRATMALCLLAGLPLLAVTAARLRETLPAPAALPGLRGFVRQFGALMVLPAFRFYAVAFALSAGMFFAFMAGAPHVAVTGLGLSPTAYAIAFALISIAYAAGNFLAGRLSRRLGTWRMVQLGTAVSTLGAIAALAAELALPPHILNLHLPMALVAMGNGMTGPNLIAAAVSVRPDLAGTASGLLGALQMAFGAAVTWVVGRWEGGSGVLTAAMMASFALAMQAMLLSRRAP